MHAANIYTKNYANGKNPQVDTTRCSHPPTVNSAYQQFSVAARLFVARVLSVRRSHPPTANSAYQQLSGGAHLLAARRAPVRRPRATRTHQPAHNR